MSNVLLTLTMEQAYELWEEAKVGTNSGLGSDSNREMWEAIRDQLAPLGNYA